MNIQQRWVPIFSPKLLFLPIGKVKKNSETENRKTSFFTKKFFLSKKNTENRKNGEQEKSGKPENMIFYKKYFFSNFPKTNDN